MRLNYTYVFQILNFVILFLLLRRYFFGPVKAYLEQRERYVHDTISAAEADRTRAARLKEESQLELSRARTEAQEIVREARRASEQIQAHARKIATEEASRIVARAREEISREKEQAFREVREHVLDLSVAVASRAIRDALDPETLRQVASQAARDVISGVHASALRGGKVS
ncbi:MAG: F0F1 ATP synthase subunit B [Firmicutes bacterium]|jgi:F-type H+-transporting ATPase subunit b|nr:F0F1 ATP synthase subunit B [Bacillota bacterium]MDH7495665.1 F0F1 ATP synthase subunit B [Bacillota bacterium]